MTDNYDQLALSWVRKEINNTLDQARQGLENFAEDTQDQTQIQFCINCLHQVQGTLQMLEFSGAAKLVAEMEKLAEKMSMDPSIAVESSFEVLMRALLQMPGYLERVEEGQKDIPVVLLPLINEVRAASSSAPVSERELFSADTTGVIPPKAVEQVSDSDKTSAFQDNAKKLRAHFQKGLTGVIRGDKTKESLARIHKVLLRLEALTEGHSVSRLWWVADGFIFAISEGGLYKRKEVHQLLSQVDKQIKRLADIGSEAMGDVIPEKLLSQLLYFVARSKSKNARVSALKEEFNLEKYLPDSEQIKKRQEKLSRPDKSAVTNVVGAINEELAAVKDQLDLFVRGTQKDPSQLQSLLQSLTRIADTLTLLELAIPRDVIKQQIKSIQKLLDLNKLPDDAVIMDVAGALLFVEANLKNVNLESQEEVSEEVDSNEISQKHAKESQVDEATQTLIKVARKSMQTAKDRMINYIASGFEREALSEVPALFDEVLGAVRIVQFDTAAEILEVAKSFVEKRIIEVKAQPQEEYLDALADVITSVEYYLEASEDGKNKGVSSILKGAKVSVDRLKDLLAQQPQSAEVVDVSATEKAAEVSETPQQIPDAGTSELTIDAIDKAAANEAEIADSSVESKAVESETVKSEPAKVIPIISSAEKEVDETLIDDEVLEIFLEEAEEEIENIDQMLPRWVNNLQDDEALTTLRRSFHTLKGSGRLVGAKVIGEFSWAMENMLNKVIEESIPAEMPVINVLNEAYGMLPSLVESFSKREATTCDYEQLIAKAEHIASGKSLSEFAYEAADESEIVDTAEEQEAVKVEAIDPLLLEIFSAEADTHLQAIDSFLKDAPAEGSVGVTDDLIRALHTLKGSAHMAGVGLIASITGPFEKYARLSKGSNQRFEQGTIALLGKTHSVLSESLVKLKASESIETEEVNQLISEISALKVAEIKQGESSGQQRDQQFVSIFLTEGLDILNEVSELNKKVSADLSNGQLVDSIRSELHTFRRGAEMLSMDALEKVAAISESFASSASSRSEIDSQFTSILDEIIESLSGMLNKVASEEDLIVPHDLLNKIEQWIEGPQSDSPPEDMDVELVELFVEEGEELIETARELISRWKDNLTSKELNGELRRIYHTLKGSSRMAGAMSVGELGYAAEDMFNTVIDFGRELSARDYEIIVSTTDKLESMIAELKRLRWPAEAESEVQVIRRHLAGDEPEEELVIEPVVDSSIQTEASETTPTESEEDKSDLVELIPESDLGTIVESEEEQIPTLELEEEEIPELNDFAALEIDEDESEAKGFGEELVLETESEKATEEVETLNDEFEVQESEELVIENESESATEEELVIDSLPQLEDSVEEEDEITLESIPSLEEPVEIPTVEEEIDSDEFAFEEEALEVSTAHDELEELEHAIPVEKTEEHLAVEEEVVQPSESTDEQSIEEVEIELPTSETLVVEDTIAPAAPVVVSGSVQKVELDEDGEEVLDIYLEEADELLVTLDEALHEWSESLENKSTIDLLQRTLHTFKGGARLSDLVVLGDLTHEMETYFEKVNAGELKAKSEDVDFLLQGYDVIAGLVSEVSEQRQMTVPEAYMQSLEKLIAGESPVAVAPTESATVEDSIEEDSVEELSPEEQVEEKVDQPEEKKAVAEVVSFEKKKQEQEAKAKPAQATEIIRVPAEQLEGLVNLAGETSIFRSRLEQQMSVLKYNLEEMSSTIERLKEQLRNLDIETEAQIHYRREITGGVEYDDFDPLEMDRYTRQQELTRGLGESAVDLLSLKETLDSLTSDSETLLLQQGRVNTEMQESLMRTRMTPFESLVPRLRRMVRQISTELGKTIELTISAEGEMDRSVLERMIAPLEHMLRNAMDHGVEPPEERRANQKPETGSIKISLYREGSEVFIKIQDDGRGLNLTAIKAKALEKGLITEHSELSNHELQQLILEAGFSTAEQVTQISGRGVGMDVVSSEIKQMGGVIEIDSVQGIGTTFTVKLPFTVSVNHALMVQLGDEVFAIPLSNIEGIVRVSPFELEEYYQNPEAHFEYAGINYSMNYLGQLLDHNRSANLAGVTQPLPVLLLHGADHPTALQVDELLGSREIVVKSLGSQLSSISGLSGATILGDGRVVLILDMPALIRRIDATVTTDDVPVVQEEEDRVPTVMVVDDSITVRKVTTRLLERHDFEVITAKDGVDALTVLGEQKPDVMLLDIEMPRMDGFELATIIRHDEGLKDLPIIMITSRTGEKHRERAEQIGVNQYMGKPYNEVDLLDTISSLLPSKA